VAELLGAPDRQVLSLGLGALAQAGARAALVVDANLDLLLEALARPTNRPAARRVLEVLRAVDTQQSAQRVLAYVRERLSEAGSRAPREAFAALAGELLQRFPELREPGEQPVVYRGRAA
jgi:DNA-binding SARP family transcriptional activator